MAQRPCVWKYLFELLAFSMATIRENLTNLTFHYFPSLLLDDKLDKNYTFQYGSSVPCRCENLNCAGSRPGYHHLLDALN